MVLVYVLIIFLHTHTYLLNTLYHIIPASMLSAFPLHKLAGAAFPVYRSRSRFQDAGVAYPHMAWCYCEVEILVFYRQALGGVGGCVVKL